MPAWLAEQGATLVLAGGLGGRAIDLLEQNGIKVVLGAPRETPETLVRAWLDGTLRTAGKFMRPLKEPWRECGN